MKLDMARFMNDRDGMLHYLAKENVVPVKAPPWADHPFELRRNEKTLRGQIGKHLVGREMTPLVLELLGVRDEQSCKAVRKRIKQIRQHFGYS